MITVVREDRGYISIIRIDGLTAAQSTPALTRALVEVSDARTISISEDGVITQLSRHPWPFSLAAVAAVTTTIAEHYRLTSRRLTYVE